MILRKIFMGPFRPDALHLGAQLQLMNHKKEREDFIMVSRREVIEELRMRGYKVESHLTVKNGVTIPEIVMQMKENSGLFIPLEEIWKESDLDATVYKRTRRKKLQNMRLRRKLFSFALHR